MTDAGGVAKLGPCPRPSYSGSAEPPTHYAIVRADLPLGVLAAQILHAAGESSPGDLSAGTNAVVLSCPNERELSIVADRLARESIPHVCIREPDPPWNGALMAIGVRPARREDVRRPLSSLPLLR